MQVVRNFSAANDSEFHSSRHRTAPIPATVSPIANYPSKLRIFLTNASSYWQVRCFLKGKTYTQSLRTANKQAAISAAKQFFHIKTAELYGEQVIKRVDKPALFADVVAATLAQQQSRVDRGELTSASLRIFQNRLQKTILPYFGTLELARINYSQLCNFVQKLSHQGLTPTTIQQHVVATRKILTYAHTVNLISSVPKAPEIKVKNKPRGSFTVDEYRQLLQAAKRSIGQRFSVKTSIASKRGQDLVDRYALISGDLYWLIRFMVNSFIRPSDIKNLQHKHDTVIRGKHIYLRLNLPESKKHNTPIVTMQPAVGVYEQLLAAHKARGLGRDEDYLFLPEMANRGKALEFLGWQFKHCLTLAGVGDNKSNGSARTLYSLRHTAITFRLLYGRKIDLLTLARNARTSVEMVEKFYSSTLAPEMNIDLLQGMRD